MEEVVQEEQEEEEMCVWRWGEGERGSGGGGQSRNDWLASINSGNGVYLLGGGLRGGSHGSHRELPAIGNWRRNSAAYCSGHSCPSA